MSKTTKEILILLSLVILCFGIWLYIWKNLKEVVSEFNTNHTGVVSYTWRWEKLPVQIIVDPNLKISKNELNVVAAHFNYFFQARYHSDMIEFVSAGTTNTAYLQLEKGIPQEMFGYTVKDGVNNRPSIFLSDRYQSWASKKRMSILMHEVAHLIGLPHFEAQASLMSSVQKEPNIVFLTEVEQELIYLLYAHKLGNDIIAP